MRSSTAPPNNVRIICGFEFIVKERRTQAAPSNQTDARACGRGFCTMQTPTTWEHRLATECGQAGWGRVLAIDGGTLQKVTMCCRDGAGRLHALVVNFAEGRCDADVPSPFALTWAPSSNLRPPLAKIIELFEQHLAHFQDLWAATDDLDAHCLVVRPAESTAAPCIVDAAGTAGAKYEWRKCRPRNACYRRVALEANVQLRVVFSPTATFLTAPELRFFGPDSAVEPWRAKVNRGILAGHLRWCGGGRGDGTHRGAGLRQSLARMGVSLQTLSGPTPSSPSRAATAMCGVCYAHRLGGGAVAGEDALDDTPNEACKNPACDKVFHASCLQQCPQGMCPYCTMFK